MRKWSLLHKKCKIREIYEKNPDKSRLMMVAGDEVPEFPPYLRVQIPGKGRLSTMINKHWLEETVNIAPNAYCAVKNEFPSLSLEDNVALKADDINQVTPMMKINMLPIEVIVKGYVTKDIWQKYSKGEREFLGTPLPEGLVECGKLPYPVFAATTKMSVEDECRYLNYDQLVGYLSSKGLLNPYSRAEIIKEYSMEIFRFAADELLHKGIILAEAKFEFGINPATGNIMLADELLTPDVAVMWDLDDYTAGRPQSRMATQPIHDFIEAHQDSLVPDELLEDAALAYDKMAYVICH